MIERQHTVGLAAAKSCFQLDHRLAVFALEALGGLHQQAGHPFCHIGACEEFDGVPVFKSALTAGHLGQIGRELCVFVPALGHIRVRLNNLSPTGQT